MASSSARLKRTLGDCAEARAAHVEVDAARGAAPPARPRGTSSKLLLEATLDEAQVVVVDEAVVARRGEDDQERVAEARDGDEVLVADEAAARLREPSADDAEDLVHGLEALLLLEGVDAVQGDVEDAELAVVEQAALHLDLDVGQRRQAGDLVVVHGRVTQHVADGLQEALGAERLGDVGGGAGAVGLHHVGELRLGREEHDRDVLGVAELQLAADLVAVHTRHHDVEQYEMRMLRCRRARGRARRCWRRAASYPCDSQGVADRPCELDVIVDHEDPDLLAGHGPPAVAPRGCAAFSPIGCHAPNVYTVD